MTEGTKRDRSRKFAGAKKPQASPAHDSAVTVHTTPSETASSSPPAKVETKTARVITLLQRQEGASLGDLIAETGWQPHTTRAAMTGLRKKGHVINSEKVDGVRRYRVGAPQ